MDRPHRSLLHGLWLDRRGLTTVEYVIVLCLIAALAVATWQQFGANVLRYLDEAKNKIDTEMQK